ncbi:hypothetical protein ABZS99_30840 [Streptomyces sp. NPDC005463]|uniref:hypothetical protein n=1 Tax=Streptomyces sp. NPDC005463 TaxID=3154465 RepID=UPI0033BC9B20
MKKPAAAQLIALKGAELALSELLAMYEVRVRQTGIIREINESLAAAGLTTLPDFSTCPTAARVRLVPVAATTTVAPAEEDPAVPADPLPPGALPQRLLLGDLPSAVGGLQCVSRGAELSQATYLMRYEGYNQIPVVGNMTELHGVVTWKSIALMYENGQGGSVQLSAHARRSRVRTGARSGRPNIGHYHVPGDRPPVPEHRQAVLPPR